MIHNIVAVDIQVHIGHFIASCVEADVLKKLFKHSEQAARADVFLGLIEHICSVGNGVNSAVLKGQKYLINSQKSFILAGKSVFWLCKDRLEIVLR